MKVKQIDLAASTGNMAWSPEGTFPIMIAAGTAAQQVRHPTLRD